MCKSQRESSARSRCRRAQPHFNTRSARKADSRTKRSSAKSSLRLARTDKSLACAISRASSSPLAITRSLATSDAVRKKMAELKQRFPAGLDYTIVYDPTVSVRESIHEVQKTLFEAIALVV